VLGEHAGAPLVGRGRRGPFEPDPLVLLVEQFL
jgi:hypothetical protein